MPREIRKQARKDLSLHLDAWLDQQLGALFRKRLAPLGVGRQEAADLLGMSRMNLHRIMKSDGRAVDLGRKLDAYLRLWQWATDTEEEEGDGPGLGMTAKEYVLGCNPWDEGTIPHWSTGSRQR